MEETKCLKPSDSGHDGIVRLAAPAGSWQPAEHDNVSEPVSWLSLPARGHRACRVAVSLFQSEPA